MTLAQVAAALSAGTFTSRQLVEQSLAAIRDPAGEGARAFLRVHDVAALAAADHWDAQRRAGAKVPVLAGIPLSLKDLFDEAGVTTLGGSRVLVGTPPATRDSTVVARLKAAGAIIIGRTTLTEFAYSGLGINPHYGTPRNVFDRAAGRIPGGSSSGAAISVTDGMAAAAIGTDTGGSVRIPSALNGLVGFKPTQRRVPLEGALPLSTSLDSAGPLAHTVADCVLLDQVLAGEPTLPLQPTPLRGVRFAVPTTVFMDDLSPGVAAAFAAALGKLSAAGATIVEVPMAVFSEAAAVNPRGAIISHEAYAWHRRLLESGSDQYDPRVISRIRPGALVSAETYEDLLAARRRFIAAVELAASGFDALLMPTVPEAAPTIAEVTADDESYTRWNLRMLRNPALVNLFDGCALSVPCHAAGAAPVGLMVAGTAGTDRKILGLGLSIEPVVRGAPA